MSRGVRPGFLVAFGLLVLAVILPIAVRQATAPRGPAIEIVDADGRGRKVTLLEIASHPHLCRPGAYENQFGNWRDEGTYCGVRLTDLFGDGADYRSIAVTAADGYRVEIDRARVEDPDYPMVLAFSYEGRAVPDWTDGLRIAVLPEDGGVSNAEYGATSAGSFWVRNVASIVLLPE